MEFPRKSSGHGRLLVVIGMTYAAVGLSSGALPVAITSHGGDANRVGLMMGASAFTVVLSRLACAKLMIRWGYRACLISAAVLLLFGSVGSTSTQPGILLIARLIVGLGVGAMLAAGTGWIIDLPSAHERMANHLASIGSINYLVLAALAPAGTWVATMYSPLSALTLAALPPVAAIGMLLRMDAPLAPARPHEAAVAQARLLTHVLGVALAVAASGNPAVVAFGVAVGQLHHVATAPAVVAVYGSSLVGMRILLSPLTKYLVGPASIGGMFIVEAGGIALCATTGNSFLFLVGAGLVGTGMAFTYPLVGAQLAAWAGPSKGPALAVLGAYVNIGIGLGSMSIGQLASRTTLPAGLLMAAATTALSGLLTSFALAWVRGGGSRRASG